MTERFSVRAELRAGDLSAIARLHGLVYEREYGLDGSMEVEVARAIADAVERGWPGADEGVWIAARGSELAGAVAVMRVSATAARVRWFIVAPSARGEGLGRRLLGALLEHVRAHGYARVELETFSDLDRAGHLYRDAGFRCTSETPVRRWGRSLVMQRYALELAADAGGGGGNLAALAPPA